MTLDATAPSTPEGRGLTAAAISRRIVKLHKEHYGKGPTRAKTYIHTDLVVVLMGGGFTKVEETLLVEGRRDAVVQQRMHFQEIMRERYSAVITEETGRTVTAFMSGTHQRPDLQSELFVLESETVSSADDSHGSSDMDSG